MPALNHALMIPGLIVVTLLFWAWIPVWALIRCMRRCTKGPPSDEERLRTGHVPHKGFDPPPPEEGIEFLPPQDFADSAPLLSEKPQQYDDDLENTTTTKQEKRGRREREYGIKTVEARTQKRREEEERAAVNREQARRHREERRERRQREEEARGKEKGKGRVSSVSGQSMDTSSFVTGPESVVTRDYSRRHHHNRR